MYSIHPEGMDILENWKEMMLTHTHTRAQADTQRQIHIITESKQSKQLNFLFLLKMLLHNNKKYYVV